MLNVKVGLFRVSAALLLAGSFFLQPLVAQRQPVSATPVSAARPLQAGHTLKWTGIIPLKSPTHPKALTFEGATYKSDGLPYFSLYLKNQAAEQFQFTNTTYQPLTAEEQAAVPATFAAPQPVVTSEIGLEMGQPVTIVSFVPLRVNPATGQKEKLVSFSYTSRPARNLPNQRSNASLKKFNSQFSESSVLNSGSPFYRLGVTTSGVYKIDRQYLASLGYNPDQINPNLIQLYGNGGGMLPQPNAAPRHNDLVQNPVAVVHNGNAVFEDGEYLLFYGEAPHTWQANQTAGRFVHTQNIYTDTTYYFITVGQEPGKRITTKANLPAAGVQFTSFDERAFYENDLENFLKSGRNWYGEKLTSFSPSKEITLPVTGMKPGSAAKLVVHVLNTSPSAATFQVALNGANAGTISVKPILLDNQGYGFVGIKKEQLFEQTFSSPPASLAVKLTYNGGSSAAAAGYLDFLQLNYERQLRLTDNQLTFRKRFGVGNSTGTFRLSNASPNTQVWDVTDPLNPVLQQGTFSNGDFVFTTDSLSIREFIAYDGNNFPAPKAAGLVPQQNLHALNLAGNLDLVIISHPKFRAEAERLAQHRRSNDGLEVAIITPQQIYNEFSSGAQDITAIRDMMRMVYSRRTAGKRINLLLFGDGSYDYKYRKSPNTNYVPIYESPDQRYNSDYDAHYLHNIETHSSDDYYGFLDENEGAWEFTSSNHLLDIGIGRLPVNTPEAAQAVVNKLISYDSPDSFGKWRNNVAVIGDDEDGDLHFNQSQTASLAFENANPNINIKKLYLDAYPQVSVASGQRSPAFVEQLNRTIDQGALIMDYIGHGSETGWMHERVLDIPQIQNWTNINKLPFFVTATCEFGRYDDPDRNSGGEYILISEKGGGIGLLTTTRPVYSGPNQTLNIAFINSAFVPVDGEMPRLGDLLRLTKNNSVQGSSNRNFALLGDPSARLAYPEHQVRITKINSQAVSAAADTLKALSKVTIEGIITDNTGNLLTSFNQQLQGTVFEKPTTVSTLGDRNGSVKEFQIRQNIIYDGLASVSSGAFKFEFVVPKDINYSFGFGKISLYSNTLNTDATGNYSNLIIGGTDPNAPTDEAAPDANLFMNDETFVFGGTTGKDATFLAKLFDENGINTAGIGIGHELKVTLDEKDEFVVNEYYTADVNSYQSGTIRFPLKGLETGPHSIKLKVWDTHNNSRDEYLEFIVVNDASLALEHVLNYPNPFSQQTTFHFDHNRAGDPLDIQIQVFTVSGRLVKTITQPAGAFSSQSHVQSVTWDGRDDYNDKLAKGVYVYKVSVRSMRDGAKAHQYQKLVILN